MKATYNGLLVIAVIVSVLALGNLIITMDKVGTLTGHATDTGSANLTIESAASISFTTSTVNWGSGQVNETASVAYLDSEGGVLDGNWTAVSTGLILQNDGNCNVTFTLTTDTAATFIGGTGSEYKLNLTDNQAGACAVGYNSLWAYNETTGSAQAACGNFSFADATDAINIDINLTIPEDALPGAKGTIVTATANCI